MLLLSDDRRVEAIDRGSTGSGSGVLTAALTCSEVFLDGGHSMD